jgi:predicted  nucleic acid-binding Zn-ribbon protein
MQDQMTFLRRRHASLFRAIENLEHNRNAIEDHRDFVGESTDIFEDTADEFKGIRDLIEQALSEVKAIRTAIEDKISELEAA